MAYFENIVKQFFGSSLKLSVYNNQTLKKHELHVFYFEW